VRACRPAERICGALVLMGVWGLAPRKILRIGLLEIECESDFMK